MPEAATQRHLEILSEIAEMLSRPRVARAAARPSPTRPRCTELISDWEPAEVGRLSAAPASTAPDEAHRHQRRGAVRRAPRPALHWEWIAGHAHPERRFDEAAVRDAQSAADLVGYLNYIHPYRVQIVGRREVRLPQPSQRPRISERRISRIVHAGAAGAHRRRRRRRRRTGWSRCATAPTSRCSSPTSRPAT